MTGSPAPSASPSPRPAWARDPIERARYLDGECSPTEKAARDADVARNPTVAARVRGEAQFLAALRRGKAADSEVSEPSELLEVRVRRALAEDRAAGFPSAGGAVVSASMHRPLSMRSLVLAGLAVAAAVALWVGGRDVQVTDASAVLAAKTFRDALKGSAPTSDARGTCEEGRASPYRFPLIANRELHLETCVQADSPDRSVSVVQTGQGGEDAKNPRGLVSVAGAGTGSAPNIGITKFDDVIVFDVSIGGAKYYLAASRAFVEKKGGDCAACHGTSRDGKPSPHTFQLRGR